MILHIDNRGAEELSTNWTVGGHTRHVEVRQHFWGNSRNRISSSHAEFLGTICVLITSQRIFQDYCLKCTFVLLWKMPNILSVKRNHIQQWNNKLIQWPIRRECYNVILIWLCVTDLCDQMDDCCDKLVVRWMSICFAQNQVLYKYLFGICTEGYEW